MTRSVVEAPQKGKQNDIWCGLQIMRPLIIKFLAGFPHFLSLEPKYRQLPTSNTLKLWFFSNLKKQISHHYKNKKDTQLEPILNMNFHSKSKSIVNTVSTHDVQTGLLC